MTPLPTETGGRGGRAPGCRVTLLTPPRRGAVAVVSVEGSQAAALVDRYFESRAGRRLTEFKLGRIIFGRWRSERPNTDASSAGVVSEEVVVCRRGAEELEVNCHGGVAAAAAILDALQAAGAVVQDSQQWLQRHAGDLLQAEAWEALQHATTPRVAAILLDQYRGALKTAVAETVSQLRGDCRDAAAAQLASLLEAAALGQHLVNPWRVVFAGPPNVGKSSLINRLLGYQRAIVYDQPGTTRDLLTAAAALDGWPVELVDTAGLRASGDAIETEGVTRAAEMVARADVVVLVFDAGAWDAASQQLWQEHPHAVAVVNKTDLQPPPPAAADCLATSAMTGAGLEQLSKRIVSQLVPAPPTAGQAVPFTARQVAALQAASVAIRQGDVTAAVACLHGLLAGSESEFHAAP